MSALIVCMSCTAVCLKLVEVTLILHSVSITNMSLAWQVQLKVIPSHVNKKGKPRVKVRFSQTDYSNVTQVPGMFYTRQ